MESLLGLIPQDKLIYAVIAIFLPAIAGFLAYLKVEKDKIVDFVVDEVDDVIADLNEAKTHMVNSLEYAEDAIEGILEALAPESLGGNVLTKEEKDEAFAMANRALTELKNAKNKLSESIRFND
jgi:lipoate-protein ligase A